MFSRFVLVSAVIAITACTKTEKILNYSQNTGTASTPIVEGIETHGGNIRMSRQDVLRDKILMTEEDYRKKYGASWDYWQEDLMAEDLQMLSLRSNLYKAWLNLYRMDKAVSKNPKVQKIATAMMEGKNGKDVFDVILDVKFDVKEVVPFEVDISESEIPTHPKYGFCLNEKGKPTTASTTFGKLGSPICVDLKFLTNENPTDFELIGLMSHELAHQFGFDHGEALELQNFVTAVFTSEEKIYSYKRIHFPYTIKELLNRFYDYNLESSAENPLYIGLSVHSLPAYGLPFSALYSTVFVYGENGKYITDIIKSELPNSVTLEDYYGENVTSEESQFILSEANTFFEFSYSPNEIEGAKISSIGFVKSDDRMLLSIDKIDIGVFRFDKETEKYKKVQKLASMSLSGDRVMFRFFHFFVEEGVQFKEA